MIERNTNNRGELWTSRGLQSYVGEVNKVEIEGIGETMIMFAGPAAILEEAKDIYEELWEVSDD
jgi:hypothetical protein